MRVARLAPPLFAAALVFSWTTTAPRADDQVFFMELPSGTLPSAVGSYASVVAANDSRGGALYWMPTSGTQSMGGRSTQAISRDGRTILGRALDSRLLENAAIWKGGRAWQLLGSFTSNAQPCDNLLSGTFGASDDGRVVVGLGWDGCRYAHAFRWEESTGMVDLGTNNGQSTRANNVSGDGRVVVGWQEDLTGFRQGAKWVGRTEELIKGPTGGMVGEAFDANRDGSIIVGAHCDPGAIIRSAWVWTASSGIRCYPVQRPPTLPDRPYSVFMFSTSEDGRVIGGSFSFGLDAESLIWLDGEAHFLTDYLQRNGYPDAFRGWVNTGFVTSVSPDGRTLVGYGAGRTDFQGFLVVLPPRNPR
jgi:probable HAF family extracellular repeat protein